MTPCDLGPARLRPACSETSAATGPVGALSARAGAGCAAPARANGERCRAPIRLRGALRNTGTGISPGTGPAAGVARRAILAVAATLGVASTTPAMAGHELTGRDLDAGARIYAQHCAACHGAQLEGAPDWQTPAPDGVYPAPPHDATGHTWHHSNVQLFDYTQLGGQVVVDRLGITGFTSGMPAFGEVLTDAQIWEVLAYIASTWPEREAAIQAARNPPH